MSLSLSQDPTMMHLFLRSSITLFLLVSVLYAQQIDTSLFSILREKVSRHQECNEHDSVFHYAEQARIFAERNGFLIQQLEFSCKQRLDLFRIYPTASEVLFRLFTEALPVAKYLFAMDHRGLIRISPKH